MKQRPRQRERHKQKENQIALETHREVENERQRHWDRKTVIEMEREGWRARVTGRDHTYKERGEGEEIQLGDIEINGEWDRDEKPRWTERERETDGDRQLEEIDTQTGMERQRLGETKM